MHKKKLLTLVTLICVTVGLSGCQSRDADQMRNADESELSQSSAPRGHRVTRVVQVIRRISGRLLIDHRVRFFLCCGKQSTPLRFTRGVNLLSRSLWVAQGRVRRYTLAHEDCHRIEPNRFRVPPGQDPRRFVTAAGVQAVAE